MFANTFRQHFAAVRRQQLGIPQTSNPVFRVENNSGRDHRPKQRATSYLVHAGYKPCAQLPYSFLKLESAPQFFEQTQLGGSGGERSRGCGLEL